MPQFKHNTNKVNEALNTGPVLSENKKEFDKKPEFKYDNQKSNLSNHLEKPKDPYTESLKDNNKYTVKNNNKKDVPVTQNTTTKKDEDLLEKPSFNPSGKTWEGKTLENNEDVSIFKLALS